jgi:hypothetical protein
MSTYYSSSGEHNWVDLACVNYGAACMFCLGLTFSLHTVAIVLTDFFCGILCIATEVVGLVENAGFQAFGKNHSIFPQKRFSTTKTSSCTARRKGVSKNGGKG